MAASLAPNQLRPAFDTTAILFCDESGNSGSNYYDRAQPVHAHAAWLVPASAQSGFDAICGELRQARPGQPESKGKRLTGSAAGQRTLRRFIESAVELGAAPIICVAEKRFCVAGKIVETYLDPYTNPHAAWLPTTADLSRPRLANQLLAQLPDSVLAAFAETYREPTVDRLRNNLRQIADALVHRMPRVAATLRGADVQRIFDADFAQRPGGAPIKHGLLISVNLMALVPLLVRADAAASAHNIDTVDVVHDDCREFEPAFQTALRLLTNVGDQRVPFDLESGPAPKMGVTRIRRLETRSSTSELALQGADALASTARVLADSAIRGAAVPADLLSAGHAIGAAYATAGVEPWVIGSMTLAGEFFRSLNIAV